MSFSVALLKDIIEINPFECCPFAKQQKYKAASLIMSRENILNYLIILI